ncbi:MAG: hypothetical protein KC457_33135, partial [Myxococcales bacterium]|nr:hypothetical protein [Myxococcales bacterium]
MRVGRTSVMVSVLVIGAVACAGPDAPTDEGAQADEADEAVDTGDGTTDGGTTDGGTTGGTTGGGTAGTTSGGSSSDTDFGEHDCTDWAGCSSCMEDEACLIDGYSGCEYCGPLDCSL